MRVVSAAWLHRLVDAYLTYERRNALSLRRSRDLENYRRMLWDYLIVIQDLEGKKAMKYRESVEIRNEILQVDMLMTGAVSVFDDIYEQIPPAKWPRLRRETLEALGNEKLVKLRDREDRLKRWISRPRLGRKGRQ